MSLGPIPDHLKQGMRKRFLEGLKDRRALDMYELDLFQWFKDETEMTWADMDAKERQYIQEQVAAGADEVNDSGVVATDYFRNRMRVSHIVFLSSLLEDSMKQECDRVLQALKDQVVFKPSELKGDPWSARRTFLERHGSFSIPDELWDPVRDLLAVRNALVHQNGDTSFLSDKQIAQLRKLSGITVDAPELGIEVSFVDDATKLVRAVIEFLHCQINALIDRAIRPTAAK